MSTRENHPKREKVTRGAFFSLPAACRLFSRGVIFTRARVSLALLSLRKNWGLLVVYTINQVGNMLVLFFHLAELKGALFGENPNRDLRIQKGFCVILSKSKNRS